MSIALEQVDQHLHQQEKKRGAGVASSSPLTCAVTDKFTAAGEGEGGLPPATAAEREEGEDGGSRAGRHYHRVRERGG